MKENKLIDPKKAKKLIFSYGCYPALVYLKELEKKQDFKNCAILFKVLKHLKKKYEFNFELSTDIESLGKTLNQVLAKIDDKNKIINNMPAYIKEFKNKLWEI